MTATNDNINCTYGIEKFDGDFEKESYGVTIIPNKSINEIRDAEALGLYAYLLSRPPGWKLNIKQLKDHFETGRDKIRYLLNWLLENKYISCSYPREKGKFTKPLYRVHLHRIDQTSNVVDLVVDQPETRASTEFSPEPEKPAPDLPAPVNQDTYKTKNIENKEYNKKTYVDSDKSTEVPYDYSDDEHFIKFYEIYPNKQKPRVAHRAFHKAAKKLGMDVPAFSQMVYEDVLVRLKNNWAGRPKNKYPFPQKYLNEAEWEGEIYTAESDSVKTNGHANGASDTTNYW